MKLRHFLPFFAIAAIVGLAAPQSESKLNTGVPAVKKPRIPAGIKQREPEVDNSTPTGNLDEQLRCTLQPVYFPKNSAALSSETKSVLDRISACLLANPSVKVLAEGHADEPGSCDYNMELGDRRARAAEAYLTAAGIAGDRIETTSYGKERLVRTGCQDEDDTCRTANRRVEWQVLSK